MVRVLRSPAGHVYIKLLPPEGYVRFEYRAIRLVYCAVLGLNLSFEVSGEELSIYLYSFRRLAEFTEKYFGGPYNYRYVLSQRFDDSMDHAYLDQLLLRELDRFIERIEQGDLDILGRVKLAVHRLAGPYEGAQED